MAAEEGYGAFAGDAGAGGAFGEHDGDGFCEEFVLEVGGDLSGFDAGLVGGCISDESCEFGGCEVVYGEEVARAEGGGCGLGGRRWGDGVGSCWWLFEGFEALGGGSEEARGGHLEGWYPFLSLRSGLCESMAVRKKD